MLSNNAAHGKSTVGRDSAKVDAYLHPIYAKSNAPTASKQISQAKGTVIFGTFEFKLSNIQDILRRYPVENVRSKFDFVSGLVGTLMVNAKLVLN